jgi:D-alanine-D-alanine ligase
MEKKVAITLLYDAIEDQQKAEAEAQGEKLPLVHEAVGAVLKERGHQVKSLPAGARIRDLVSKLSEDKGEIIFNLCESLAGVGQHEQNVAALLELMGKRFTGSPSLGLALAQDKAMSKKLFSFHGIPYPKFSIIDQGQVEWSDDLCFPLFVKPLNQDASIGIDENSIVKNVRELMERISYLRTEFDAPALIEEYIEGREIYVGVLGTDKPQVLPILEWDFSKVPKHIPPIASAEAKWDAKSPAHKAPEVFPEDLPEEVTRRIEQAALDAFIALKMRDYARIDMRLVPPQGKAKSDPDAWQFFIIEANPNPHLDAKSEFALAARKRGISFPDLLEGIVEGALHRTIPPFGW